jgi:TonB family protein
MTGSIAKTVTACLVITAVLVGGSTLHAQDALAEARQLYASAEYENALALLEQLSAADGSHGDRQAVELYRTLCLLAIGREAEADRVIEAMIANDPLYRPDGDLSPRVRAVFADVKGRLLPAIVQRKYGEAKTAFDDRDFEAAAGAFTDVVAALDDPDIANAAEQPPLADLRTLAEGFRDLSLSAMAPPPPPVPATPPPPVAPVLPSPSLEVYTGEEAGVVPPRVIRQDVPRYPGSAPAGGVTEGVVEVLINERGTVESATMAVPLALAVYNRMVLSAASGWRYEPATVGGVAVKFRKRLQISVAPATR